MSARGNSGVILSQIVRGAAEVLGAAATTDSATVARASAARATRPTAAVRKPVEGTMLTVIRELAEPRRKQPTPTSSRRSCSRSSSSAARRRSPARPSSSSSCARPVSSTRAAAGLLELVRGLAAAAAGRAVGGASPSGRSQPLEAVHLEPSRYRYCTTFVVEGEQLDAAALEAELETLGDSLLVVGDSEALKIHVHTDDPGAALSLGTRAGTIEAVEIADMHRQTEQREERLLAALARRSLALGRGRGGRRRGQPPPVRRPRARRRSIEGGQTMNPSTADLLEAVEADRRRRGSCSCRTTQNVLMAAEQAARVAGKPVHVVPTESIPAGLAALVALSRRALGRGERGRDARGAAAGRDRRGDRRLARRRASTGSPCERATTWRCSTATPVAAGPSFDEVTRVAARPAPRRAARRAHAPRRRGRAVAERRSRRARAEPSRARARRARGRPAALPAAALGRVASHRATVGW